jgi:hypothetical protein
LRADRRDINPRFSGKFVFGSALTMTDAEKFNVKCRIFDRMELGQPFQNNLEVLRQTGVLLHNLVPH